MPDKRYLPPLTRRSGVRDARLIIIAAEGTNTEKQYFDALRIQHHNSHIHVEVIERDTLASDPAHVMKCLDDFRKQYRIRSGYDELWLVMDRDKWHEQNLSEIAAKCQQKIYSLAVSNPCFEFWLLLHIKSLDEYSSDVKEELLANRKTGNRTRLETELLWLLGAYNKSNLDPTPFLPHVAIAIARARSLDTHPEYRWPNHLGTRVYLLAEKIIGDVA